MINYLELGLIVGVGGERGVVCEGAAEHPGVVGLDETRASEVVASGGAVGVAGPVDEEVGGERVVVGVGGRVHLPPDLRRVDGGVGVGAGHHPHL